MSDRFIANLVCIMRPGPELKEASERWHGMLNINELV
jgi:hypothetical protein